MVSATNISLDTMYATSLTENDIKYFCFTTPNKKGFYFLYGKDISIGEGNYVNTYCGICVMNSLSEEIAGHSLRYNREENKNFALLPNTTYYIKATTSENRKGNLKFKISFTEDLEGDSQEDAMQYNVGQFVSSSLDGVEDVDYYKFKTDACTKYKIEVQNISINVGDYMNDYTNFVIENKIKEKIFEGSLCYTQQKEEYIKLLPNTEYFIKISNWSGRNEAIGNYSFIINKQVDVSDVKINGIVTGISVGDTINFNKIVLPQDATNQEVEWCVDNSGIASIDRNGYFQALKPGEVTVSVKSNENNSITDQVTIKIIPKQIQGLKLKKSKGKIKATWKLLEDNEKYQIQWSTNFKFKNKKSALVSYKKTYAFKSKKRKTYYVRVCGIYYQNGNKYIGNWSTVKKIKAK